MNTFNKFLVGAQGDELVIGRPPARLTYDDALLLAAFLVAMAEPFASERFAEVLRAVKSA